MLSHHLFFFQSQQYADLSLASACGHDSSFRSDGSFLESQTFGLFIQIFQFMRMFVLGPRLVLSIREYHAKLVADSDTATAMTPIAFQECVHVSTSSSCSTGDIHSSGSLQEAGEVVCIYSKFCGTHFLSVVEISLSSCLFKYRIICHDARGHHDGSRFESTAPFIQPLLGRMKDCINVVFQ